MTSCSLLEARDASASPDRFRWFKILKSLLILSVDFIVQSQPLIVKRHNLALSFFFTHSHHFGNQSENFFPPNFLKPLRFSSSPIFSEISLLIRAYCHCFEHFLGFLAAMSRASSPTSSNFKCFYLLFCKKKVGFLGSSLRLKFFVPFDPFLSLHTLAYLFAWDRLLGLLYYSNKSSNYRLQNVA